MKNTLDDEAVLAYLKSNPDFFDAHPDALPVVDRGTGVVDFQQKMLGKLKNDKSKVQQLQRELIENVRANMNNQTRIQAAVLTVLEADSFEEFVELVTQQLPVILDVDTINLIIESASKEVPFVNLSGIRFAKAGTVTKWLSTGDALLQDNIQGHEELFGPGAGLVRSHALVRLEISEDTPSGIIAFGSRDPEAFMPNHAVDQIGFLAQVVERCFRIWLGLQG
ncbi:MAG: DUF484 family protein [Alphaproteobacteria bacterium]|nr:DUF484 family protein [Alphaproteobacteria bacterium]MDE2335933.1 DUF484 family protein [Alphaproteobacteria bacterium]